MVDKYRDGSGQLDRTEWGVAYSQRKHDAEEGGTEGLRNKHKLSTEGFFK